MTTPSAPSDSTSDLKASSSDNELLATLFDLGREVTSVLHLHELLEKIPQLIARVTPFTVFAVYLVDERQGDLRIAYAVGYPEEVVQDVPASRRPGRGGHGGRRAAPDPGG